MPTSGAGSPRAQATLSFLRHKIVSGEWPVNTRIPTEPELMAMIGVGRTTVREAVRSLASMGMLETLVSRGTYVRSRMPVSSVLADFITEFDVVDLIGFRRALEIEGAASAARSRTEDDLVALRAAHAADVAGATEPTRGRGGRSPGPFHHVLLEATGNRLTSSLYLGVMAALRSAIERGEVVHSTDAAERRADHAEILAAVEDGDVGRAASAMARHADRDLVVPGHEASQAG